MIAFAGACASDFDNEQYKIEFILVHAGNYINSRAHNIIMGLIKTLIFIFYFAILATIFAILGTTSNSNKSCCVNNIIPTCIYNYS